VGLSNQGNTCFMNAALQCLGAISTVIGIIDKASIKATCGTLVYAFREHLGMASSGDYISLAPTHLKALLAKRHGRYEGNMRDDSIDFVLRFLKALHDDCNLTRQSKSSTQITEEGIFAIDDNFAQYFELVAKDAEDGGPSLLYHQLAQHFTLCGPLCHPQFKVTKSSHNTNSCAEQTWARFALKHRSPVMDAFAFQLHVEATCARCGHAHHWFPVVCHLSIELPLERKGMVKYSGCAHCNSTKKALSLCSQCRFVGYCSNVCQRNHWPFHKPDCTHTPRKRKAEGVTLDALLDDKFSPPHNTIDEVMRKCEGCMAPLPQVRMAIWSLPKILIIHLSRNKSVGVKVDTKVIFPAEKFDIGKRVTGPNRSLRVYDLCGVTEHGGNSQSYYFGQGHFEAKIKLRNSGSWCTANDTIVRPCDHSAIITNRACVMYYEQKLA